MGRTGKWIVAIALMLIVGSLLTPVVYVIGLANRGRAVDREIARIRAAGEPVSTADLAGRPIPDGENAALVYLKCLSLLPRSPRSPDSGLLRDFLRPERRAQDPKLWGKTKVMLDRYRGVLSMAEKAAAMPKCRYPVDRATSAGFGSDRLRGLRQLVRYAAAQALVESKNGRADAAIRHIKLAYRIAEPLKDERVESSQRVVYSCIESASDAVKGSAALVWISESQARSVASAIDRLDLRDSVRYSLLGKRAAGITFYAGVERGDVAALGAENTGSGKMFKRLSSSLPGRIWLYSDELYYLSEMRRYLELAHTPYRIRKARVTDPGPDVPQYALFASLLIPSVDTALWAADHASADNAGSRIFLGLLAYRDRFRSYPASLDELKAKLSWRLPDDPFSGRPFIYRKQGKGFLLYSVGDDLKDDHGIETARNGSGDIVWRLSR